MAQISGMTGLSVIDDIVNSEVIDQLVHAATETPYLYQLIMGGNGTKSLVGKATRTYAHPIWAEMTAAATLAETEVVSSTALSSSEVTIGAAVKARATFVSDQAARSGVLNTFSLAINRVTGACMRAINDDTLALSTSISASIGSNATTNDASNLNVAVTAFRALVKSNLSGTALCVLHGDALRDLNEDAVNTTNAIYSSTVGENLFNATNAVSQGGQSPFGKLVIVDSDDVSVGDTTGWTNMIIDVGGMDTAFGLVVANGVSIELERDATRLGTWVVGSADYGVGILDQSRAQAFITKT